jgi:hypothetical protein
MKKFFEWIKLNEMPLISIKDKSAFAGDEKLKDVNVDEISDNIVMFRQPESENSFIAPGSTWVYFMDSEESAQDMRAGKIPMLMVPRGAGMNGGNPITDIWNRRYAKPGTEHILGVIEGNTNENEIYIEMMTVRPKYRRNSINSKMIQYIRNKFPMAKVTYSSPTKDGKKFITSSNE